MVSTAGGPPALLLAAIGLGAGVLSGLFGVGGGIILVPALALLAGMAQQRASATSLAAIVPIAAVGALVFGRAESVDLAAALVLAAGSVVGVQAGTWLMPKVGDERLRIGFAIFMVAVALTMLLS
jgi:uncharacterized membrane protein YfcA